MWVVTALKQLVRAKLRKFYQQISNIDKSSQSSPQALQIIYLTANCIYDSFIFHSWVSRRTRIVAIVCNLRPRTVTLFFTNI